MISSRWAPVWKATLFLAAYQGAVLLLSGPSVHREAVVWLPTGVAVAGLWLLGPQYWWVIALGTILGRTSIGRPFVLSILPATGNVLEALVALYILRQLAFRPACDRLRDSLLLLLAAAVAPLLSTAAGLYQYWLADVGWPASRDASLGWWRMNALGGRPAESAAGHESAEGDDALRLQ